MLMMMCRLQKWFSSLLWSDVLLRHIPWVVYCNNYRPFVWNFSPIFCAWQGLKDKSEEWKKCIRNADIFTKHLFLYRFWWCKIFFCKFFFWKNGNEICRYNRTEILRVTIGTVFTLRAYCWMRHWRSKTLKRFLQLQKTCISWVRNRFGCPCKWWTQ